KQEVIDGLSALELPENPLDQLVNHFGECNVAELTGRTRRLIRDSRGHVEYKKRNPEGVAMHRTNVHEMEQFQSGKKHVAIISDAAAMEIRFTPPTAPRTASAASTSHLSLAGLPISKCRLLAGHTDQIKPCRLSTSCFQR